MSTKIPADLELIADYACTTGEGPTWHSDEKALYWTDIPNGRLFRFDSVTGRHEQVYEGRVVGGMTVQEDGKLLLFMDEGSVAIWDGKDLEFVVPSLPQEVGNRFNDVIADPEGRVFCGTMSTPSIPGRLYRLDPDRSIHLVYEGTKTSNGMGFSPDRKTFYFTDTGPGEIYTFDYDRVSGAISNQRCFAKVDRAVGGGPDGMTVDQNGDIWSCRWDGSRIVKYAPTGEELGEVDFPVKKVSSITFGGSDFQDAYITTAGGQDKAFNGALAGSLFRTRLGVSGIPEFRSRIV